MVMMSEKYRMGGPGQMHSSRASRTIDMTAQAPLALVELDAALIPTALLLATDLSTQEPHVSHLSRGQETFTARER